MREKAKQMITIFPVLHSLDFSSSFGLSPLLVYMVFYCTVYTLINYLILKLYGFFQTEFEMKYLFSVSQTYVKYRLGDFFQKETMLFSISKAKIYNAIFFFFKGIHFDFKMTPFVLTGVYTLHLLDGKPATHINFNQPGLARNVNRSRGQNL